MRIRARSHAGGVAVLVGACVLAGSSAVGPAAAQSTTTPAAPSSTTWLCRPGVAPDPCTSDLATTVARADGSTTVEHPQPASNPKLDCFYVYPTVSHQTGTNADVTIDPEEIRVAQTQASRFSQVCRVFAPMYPQITVSGLMSPAGRTAAARVTAYAGVLEGWKDYLAHDNHGRGVLFIGHSQGASMLTALLKREIDPNPVLRKQLVGAYLIGGNVTVAKGQDVGGSFQHIPACAKVTQTGCVVAYSSFDQPPPADSLFGRAGRGVSVLSGQTATDLDVLCVNPAKPGGGTGSLQSFFRTAPFPGPLRGNRPSAYQATTPWVQLPRLYTAHCQQADGATWLQIHDIGTKSDTRPRVQDSLGPTWGLHLVDVNLALGNLVDMARAQGRAFRP